MSRAACMMASAMASRAAFLVPVSARLMARAAARGIPTATVDHRDFPRDRKGFEAELHATLEARAPDILCLAGFMRVLTAEFVDRWQGRILNIHPSLLPKILILMMMKI